MSSRPPLPQRKPGVCYALTDEGVELPVIDVTHPAFRLDLSAGDLAQRLKDHVRMMRRRERLPAFLGRLLMRLASRRSALIRGILGAEGGFLSGMNTYLMKLGPANLVPGFSSRVDRQVADSFPAVAARIRLQEAARRLALGLAPALAARPGPLHFVNIAGGPASDSLNALILLRSAHPEWLEGRRIHIHVLDLHRDAPRFGARARAALCAEGGPLSGLTVAFGQRDYDWSDTRVLRELLAGLEPDSVVVGSSEGGLFNYGSDQAIRANLVALREATPADFVMVGSLSWDTPRARRFRRFSQIAVRDFTREAFESLADEAGWALEQGIHSPTRQVVCLVKRPDQSSQ